MSAGQVSVALPDLDAVGAFGKRIARVLRPGDVVALSGGLGAGKTTLARAILASLGHPGEVPSPTFTIIESYDAPPLAMPAVHADFYRLEDPAEIAEIGLDDYREGAVLIAEWPECAGGFAHEPACLDITLKPRAKDAEEGRIAIVKGGSDWLGRMP
ncbi:MAG: tRNA (adenosine(37)-N6)-threonylcarbamoyltransferase complex ATPase subunit type 1 TsaE [Erythrobacter sp.]|uniref:tRNA (adenosine(37)-N6)-threonylcarbamoyltransferase complex ATPase subunit type 1 TsaE n=1 Tax=Erythrobacter sp. TaxID=1042 RepID=UPI0032EDA92B